MNLSKESNQRNEFVASAIDAPTFADTDSIPIMNQRKENKEKRLRLWRAARREDYFEDSYDSMYSYACNHDGFHSPIRCTNSVVVQSPEKNASDKEEYDKYHIPGDDASMYDFASNHGEHTSPAMRPAIDERKQMKIKDAKIYDQLNKGVRKMQPRHPIPREIEVNMESRSIGIPQNNKVNEECLFHNEQIKSLQTHESFDNLKRSSDSSRMNIVSNEKMNRICSWCLEKKKRKVDQHVFLPSGSDSDLK